MFRNTSGVLPLLLLYAFQIRSITATKHVFRTKKDTRFFIAPIGEPFGFSAGGGCTLTVNNYDLIEKRVDTTKKTVRTVGEDERAFEGGFVLKRFKTESQFVRFEKRIIKDPLFCVYDEFRKGRRLQLDDEFFDNDVADDWMDDWMEGDDDDQLGNEVDDGFKFNDDDDDDYYEYDDDVLTDDDHATTKATPVPQAKAKPKAPVRNHDVAKDGIYLSMKDERLWGIKRGEKGAPTIKHTFKKEEEGQYFLVYQVCATRSTALFSRVSSSFQVNMEFHNVDKLGRLSYLTAGEVHLPLLFLFFGISYFLVTYIWTLILRGDQAKKVDVRAVHHLMTATVFLKACSVVFESVRYHFIATKGHAEIWSFVYYSLTFLKGVMLFSVILLIGSGWSLVRPFLQNREKKIVLAVLVLQVVDNIAVVFLLTETEGERQYNNWRAVLHLIDIICCCVVLLPIVWQVSALESRAETSENSRTLRHLKLFRSFYLLVMTYIYFTRVVVYLVSTALSYKYTWVSSLLTELGTLSFFVVTGYFFRPEAGDENSSLDMKSTVGMNGDEAEYGEVEESAPLKPN